MNEIKVFEFGSNDVRVIMDESGNPWWVASDVCDILDHTNPSMAINSLDEDERAKKSLGRQGETNIINESGLYTLIIRSNKPQAKKFRRWITHEVLPSIRKTGGYSTRRPEPEMTNFPNLAHLVRYLNDLGCNVSYAKVMYDRKRGQVAVQPDGSVLIEDADRYVNHLTDKAVEKEFRRLEQTDIAADRMESRNRVDERKILMEHYKATLELAKGLGLPKSEAVEAACRLVEEETGADLMGMFGVDWQCVPAYRTTEDIIRNFFNTGCVIYDDVDSGVFSRATELYEHFLDWLKRNEHGLKKPFSQKKFGMTARKFFRCEKRGGVYIYHGVVPVNHTEDVN